MSKRLRDDFCRAVKVRNALLENKQSESVQQVLNESATVSGLIAKGLVGVLKSLVVHIQKALPGFIVGNLTADINDRTKKLSPLTKGHQFDLGVDNINTMISQLTNVRDSLNNAIKAYEKIKKELEEAERQAKMDKTLNGEGDSILWKAVEKEMGDLTNSIKQLAQKFKNNKPDNNTTRRPFK